MKFATIGRQNDLSVSPSYFSHAAVTGRFISRVGQSPGGKLSVAQARLKFLKFAFASGLAYLMRAP